MASEKEDTSESVTEQFNVALDDLTPTGTFSLEETKDMLNDPSEKFDFVSRMEAMRKHKIEKFEKERLDDAQQIIHKALEWFSGGIEKKAGQHQLQEFIIERIHPSTQELNSSWIIDYAKNHCGGFFDIGMVEPIRPATSSSRTLIIKPKSTMK